MHIDDDDDDDDDNFDTYLADDVFATETIVFVEGKQTYVSVLLEGDMMISLHHWRWEKGAKSNFACSTYDSS
jgi:hypothetical protein